MASWEADFQAADKLLLDPPRVQQKTLLLLGTVAAFVGVSLVQGSGSALDLAMLVGVLLVHELGHAAAMVLLGYRDVRIFFIPFFGAAAAGRRRGVARYKQAIVLLAGPVPGIVAGGALAAVGPPALHTLALLLLVVNALNLLPVAPLDGGQLFSVLLFSRQRHLEVIFLGVAGGALAVVGLLGKIYVFAVIGYVLLVTLGHRKRVLDAAHRWRGRDLVDDPAALSIDTRRELWKSAWDLLPPRWQARWRGKAKPQAATMQEILERATQRPPGWAATAGLFAAWLAAVALAIGGLYAVVFQPNWHVYSHDGPHFTVDMPRVPTEQPMLGGHAVSARLRHSEYGVMWLDDPNLTLDNLEAGMKLQGRDIADLPAPAGERRFTMQKQSGFVAVRLVFAHGDRFMVLATAPTRDLDALRFVDSFRP